MEVLNTTPAKGLARRTGASAAEHSSVLKGEKSLAWWPHANKWIHAHTSFVRVQKTEPHLRRSSGTYVTSRALSALTVSPYHP